MSALRCLIYGFLFLASVNAIAQETETELLAGPDLVSLVVKQGARNADIRLTPAIGVGFNYHFSSHWSTGLKVLYERKGSKSSGTIPASFFPDQQQDVSYTLKYNLDYVVLPLMTGYTFGKHIKWSAELGPYISFLLKAKQIADIQGGIPGSTINQTSSYKSIDAGLALAVSMAVPLTERLSAKATIMESLGLTDINNFPPNEFFDNTGSIKTNSINLRLGISYQFSSRPK